MIQVKEATNKKKWEQYIDRYAPDALFQRWDWGEVVKKQQEEILRLEFCSHGKTVAIAQCLIVKAKRGNFLHVRHGPILTKWEKRLFLFVTRHLQRVARQKHCVSVRISPRIERTNKILSLYREAGAVASAIHAMDAEHAWVLDLTPSEEVLLSGMRKTTRYEIRKAMKMGVATTISTTLSDISVFLSLYADTAKRQGFVKHKGIMEEVEVFTKNGNGVIINGYFDGNPIASAIILFHGHQAIYHHGASIPSNIPVSYLVQWVAIQEAKKRGMKEYNFWGIAPEGDTNHPWSGLSAFKKGFGGHEIQRIHAYDFPVSWRYWFLYVVEWLRKQQKGYS